MDADLYPVLQAAAEDELELIHRYAQLYQTDVACEPEALTRLILDKGYNDYQSTLRQTVQHLGGSANIDDPVAEMEATMMTMLFNRTLLKMPADERFYTRKSWHRFGLRDEDWHLVMDGEEVDFDRLKFLLMAEGYRAECLTDVLIQLVFGYLLTQGDDPDSGELGLAADVSAHIIFGPIFCLMTDALNGIFGVSYGKMIPITLLVAQMRKRQLKHR